MLLKSLLVKNFRLHVCREMFFDSGVHVITGNNGIGKTTLLEAIHFLSTGRSFRTSQFKELIHQGSQFFYIEATFIRHGITQSLKIGYDGKKKLIQHNESDLPSFSALLGILPSVISYPGDVELIMGSPSERRRFLNIYLGQKDTKYAQHLLRYAKALECRNYLLKRKHLQDPKEMLCFETAMIHSAAYIMSQRQLALKRLSEKTSSILQGLVNYPMAVEMQYQTSLSIQHGIDIESLKLQYAQHRDKEYLLGATLIGPHRDDIYLIMNNRSMKSFASEGQKRIFLNALKIAEWSLLKEDCGEPPLMCIDDVGAHLDTSTYNLLDREVHHLGQVFLTSTTKLNAFKTSPIKFFELNSQNCCLEKACH